MNAVSARADPPYFSFPPVRTRLFASLTQGAVPASKLTTVTAPTGYGKTVLLGSLYTHYRQAGCDCRWLALDDRDSSIERVLAHLEELLRAGDLPVDPRQALHQGDEPVETRIDAVVEAAAATSRTRLLFIDNLNACVDETLHRLLDALIFRTPASVHLVFASTGELPCHQSRAKLEGRLRAIRPDELSLDDEAIRALFGPELCERLGDAALATVREQTEGWPAAVRLMQIVLSNAEAPEQALRRFSGADEDLAALLNRQVLQTFAPEFRQFLLEVALLRSFNVNLCRHAGGDAQAAEHVRQLLRHNLFVIPLDRKRSWYRLHALFREFLLDEAERQLPLPRRAEILARAAEWCENEGRWVDAVEYAQASGSVPLTAAILERIAALFVRDRGDLRQYIEWVEQLHRGGHRGGWETDYWYVWALVFHRRYEYARAQADLLTARLQRGGAAAFSRADAREFRRRIDVIRLAIDIYTDRLGEAREQALQWLADAAGADPFNVATVACAAAIERASMFASIEARALCRQARSAIAQADSDYGNAWVGLIGAMVPLLEGDFAEAHHDLQALLARTRESAGDAAGITGTVAMLAAKSAVETGQTAQAAEWLALGLRRAQTHGMLDTTAFGLDAGVKLWSGDPADESLAALREIAAAYPPRLALMLSCFEIRRLLRVGRLDEAALRAEQLGLGGSAAELEADDAVRRIPCVRDLLMASRIELHIAAGRLRQAAALIAEESKLARADNRYGRLVELALDEAQLANVSHNPAPAARHLTRAISLAARRRYVRAFADRASLVASLVNDTKAKDWGFANDEERQFFTEICALLPAQASTRELIEQERDKPPQLSETPTARELELLALVDAGLSNQQLADRLSVSVATVKWHLYNLYSKLGVSSRSAALARARGLNLLAR